MHNPTSLRQSSFAIVGMFCAQCAVTIERALAQVEGVVAAQVNLATERATVVYNPARISLSKMVRTVQSQGFDVLQQHILLNVEGLMYTSSARTVARVLECIDGVAHASVDLKTQQIELAVFAERENRLEYEREITKLGLRLVDRTHPDSARVFILRMFLTLALTVVGLVSAGAHAGWYDVGFIHAPLVVMVGAVVIAYGIAWRFYRIALETALLSNTFDASVIIALIVLASLFIGLPLALLAPTSMFTSVGFIIAMLLTTGWFIGRAMTILQIATRIHQLAPQPALGLLAQSHDFNPRTK